MSLIPDKNHLTIPAFYEDSPVLRSENWRAIDRWASQLPGTVSNPLAFDLITSTTLSAPAASASFTSIPQTFRNLLIIVCAGSDQLGGSQVLFSQLNGDAGPNYYALANRTVATPASSAIFDSAIIEGRMGIVPNRNYGATSITLVGYSGTASKQWIYQTTAFGATIIDFYSETGGGFWNNASPITSILLFPQLGNLTAGSVFELYGST